MADQRAHTRDCCTEVGKESGPTFNLRTILLLAGGVRRRGLASKLGRSVLDLPLAPSVRLLDVWKQRIEELTRFTGSRVTDQDVRIVVSPSDPLPRVALHEGRLRLHAERDVGAYRGTAGVLRDICEPFDDDEHVLVGTASQCPDAGVVEHLLETADADAGVTLLAGDGGAPSGLMVVRCGALRQIPAVGYVDFKEQALPHIVDDAGVRVVRLDGSVSPPIRSVRTYIDVMRSWHEAGSLRGARAMDPFEERGESAFAVVEPGALVEAGARLHDSVVLTGGTVQHGAEVVRSVIGPGGVVRRRGLLLDELVLGAGREAAGAPDGVPS